MGRPGSETEELIDQADFSCRSRDLKDAVAAADYTHDLKAFDRRLGCCYSLKGERARLVQ
jgi:hypothetical protein